MNLISKSKFAELCGKPQRWLATYWKRGKIVLVGEQIDTDEPINKLFLEKWAERKTYAAPIIENKPPPLVKKNIEVELLTNETTDTDDDIDDDKSFNITDLRQLDTELKISLIKRNNSSIKKTNVERRIKEIQEQQKRGETIPTEVVKHIVAQLSKSFITKFQQAAENYLMDISKKYSMSRADVADLRGKLIDTINKSSHTAVEDSKKALRNIVSELAIKKGVGEHG